MNRSWKHLLDDFLAVAGLAEMPMGMYFTDTEPVLGGWDISARKFFKGDEITLTVPLAMFERMVTRYRESFLMKKPWATVKKKIERSRKVWGEENTAVNLDEQLTLT